MNINVAFPVDAEGRSYVAITVAQFDEVPTICRRDADGINAGVVYYRNRNRRMESAPVSNSYDMREIIDLSTVAMMQRIHRMGLVLPPVAPVRDQLNAELGGL